LEIDTIAILVVLMIANLAALITFISINNKMAKRPCYPSLDEKSKHRPPHHELLKELQLDENQAEQFAALRKKYADEARNNFREIKGIRDSIFTELIKDEPDTAILKIFNNKLILFQQEMTTLTYYHILEVKKVLNKEQQNKYFKFLNKKIPGFHFPSHRSGGKKDNCSPPPFFEVFN